MTSNQERELILYYGEGLSSRELRHIHQLYNQQKRSIGTACLLCLFLGGIGIHQFYLKSPVAGVIYLLFCWTFIPLILSVIELLLMGPRVNGINKAIIATLASETRAF